MRHSRIREMLLLHEGIRLRAYDDATGRLIMPGDRVRGYVTVGVGRNLISRGLTREEALYLLENDIKAVEREVKYRLHDIWAVANDARRDALLDMAFNLGINGLLGFSHMLAAMRRGDWRQAATEMLDSRWADQVGRRAIRLARMVESGTYEALDEALTDGK